MSKLFLALPLFVIVLTTVLCEVKFIITNTEGEKDEGTKYEDIKQIIMDKYGYIMTKEGVMPQFSELNKKALENEKFAAISAKVLAGEDLTPEEDEEFVKLHFEYFGKLIIQLYEEENLKFEYIES